MTKKPYLFKKTHEMDKAEFAKLLQLAKGGRTMKDFADECGVNPSTFTRITQMANKGASSTELLEAIAAHTVSTEVTLEKLATANGYTLIKDEGLTSRRLSTYFENEETLVRNVLVQALLDRNAGVRLGNIKYQFSKSLALSPDALIMTDAFGAENEIWFVDSMLSVPRVTRDDSHPIHKSRVKQIAFEKFSRFVFISMNKVELFRPVRFSMVVFDREVYDIIVDEFAETVVPTDISIILIDSLNNCIADEFMLPHITKGNQASYFKTTAPFSNDECDYLNNDIYSENE